MNPRFDRKAAEHASPKFDFGIFAEAADKLLLIFLSAGDLVGVATDFDFSRVINLELLSVFTGDDSGDDSAPTPGVVAAHNVVVNSSTVGLLVPLLPVYAVNYTMDVMYSYILYP